MSTFERRREWYKSNLSKATYKEYILFCWTELLRHTANLHISLDKLYKIGDERIYNHYLTVVNSVYEEWVRELKNVWWLISRYTTLKKDEADNIEKWVDILSSFPEAIMNPHERNEDGTMGKTYSIRQIVSEMIKRFRKIMRPMIELNDEFIRFVNVGKGDSNE